MAECAELLGSLRVLGIVLTENLVSDLDAIQNIDAVAIPFSVGVEEDDGVMADAVSAALEQLILRGIPVFVAAGNRNWNPLADAGIAVDSNFSIEGIQTPARVGTSGRAVLAAAHAAQRKRK